MMAESREVVPVPLSLFNGLPGITAMHIWVPRLYEQGTYSSRMMLMAEDRVPAAVRERLALHPVTQKRQEEHERALNGQPEWSVGRALYLPIGAILVGAAAVVAMLSLTPLPSWAAFLGVVPGAGLGVLAFGQVASAQSRRIRKQQMERCRGHDSLMERHRAAMIWTGDEHFTDLFAPLSWEILGVRGNLGPELSSTLSDALGAFMEWQQAEASTKVERQAAESILARAHGDESPEVAAVDERLGELRRDVRGRYEVVEGLRDVALDGLGARREELHVQGLARDRERARAEARVFLDGS